MSKRTKCPQCKDICGRKAPVEVVRRLEILYRKLLKCGPDSPLIKYLPRNIFDVIKYKITLYNMTLLDCLQAGFQFYDRVGMYITDPDCFNDNTFRVLFDHLVKEYYNMKEGDVQPPIDFGPDPSSLANLDPSKEYVESTRIRVSRALKRCPFNQALTEEQYREIEIRIEAALLQLTGDLAGTYVRFKDMSEDEMSQLRASHILPQKYDEELTTAKFGNYWPEGRGYFTNERNTFIVWVNEKDHMRLMSKQKGGNLGKACETMLDALIQLDEKLSFAKDERFGFLSSNPFSLGTGMKASVHIKLPKLAKDKEKLAKVAECNNFVVKGVDCDLNDAVGGKFDLSTKQIIGLTEYEILQGMVSGMKTMIKTEKAFKPPPRKC